MRRGEIVGHEGIHTLGLFGVLLHQAQNPPDDVLQLVNLRGQRGVGDFIVGPPDVAQNAGIALADLFRRLFAERVTFLIGFIGVAALEQIA